MISVYLLLDSSPPFSLLTMIVVSMTMIAETPR